MFYTLTKWIGPEMDDVEYLAPVFEDDLGLISHIEDEDLSLYDVLEWDRHPDTLGSDVVEITNAKEYFISIA